MDGIKTFVGNLELIKSEIAYITSNNKLSISFNETMFIEFAFNFNDKDKSASVTTETKDDNLLVINCLNFTNSLGQGLIDPLEVGTFNQRKLYISFFVWTPDPANGKRLVNYSFYLEKL